MKITKTWFKKEIEITTQEILEMEIKLHPDTHYFLWIRDLLVKFTGVKFIK